MINSKIQSHDSFSRTKRQKRSIQFWPYVTHDKKSQGRAHHWSYVTDSKRSQGRGHRCWERKSIYHQYKSLTYTKIFRTYFFRGDDKEEEFDKLFHDSFWKICKLECLKIVSWFWQHSLTRLTNFLALETSSESDPLWVFFFSYLHQTRLSMNCVCFFFSKLNSGSMVLLDPFSWGKRKRDQSDP